MLENAEFDLRHTPFPSQVFTAGISKPVVVKIMEAYMEVFG